MGQGCEGRRITGLSLQAEVKAGTAHPPLTRDTQKPPNSHTTHKVTIPPQLPQGKHPWSWNHGGFAAIATRCLSRGAWISRNHSDPGHGGRRKQSPSPSLAAAPPPLWQDWGTRGIGLQSHYGRESFIFYCDSGKGLWPDPKGEALPDLEAGEEGERRGR